MRIAVGRKKAVAAAAILAVCSIPSIAVGVDTAKGEVPNVIPARVDPAVTPASPVPEDPAPHSDGSAEATSVTAGAVTGQDGWVFYGDAFNHNYAQAMGQRRLSSEELAAFAASVTSLRDYLSSRGVPLLFVVAPAKWEIYGDKLGRPAEATSTLDQVLHDEPQLQIVDTRKALRDARATADTFSKLNGHWTDYGGLVAWKAIQEQLPSLLPGLVAPVPPTSGITTVDLGDEFASGGAPRPNQWTKPTFDPPLPEIVARTTDGATSTLPADQPTDMLEMPRTTVNASAPNDSKVLALCDSTCRALSPLMQASYAELTQVRHYIDQAEKMPRLDTLLEQYRPDFVIFLMAERYLDFGLPSLPR